MIFEASRLAILIVRAVQCIQVAFARSAAGDKALQRAYRRHAAISGFGLGCFMLEDAAIERGHSFVHSLWHLHACYAVASTNALMQKREQSDPAVEGQVFANGA